MKSPMIQSASYIKAAEKGRYTDLQVLRSAAGWYIGTMFQSPDGFEEPGSRDSDYFETEEEAQRHLDMLNSVDETTAAQFLRASPDEVTPVAARKKREAIARFAALSASPYAPQKKDG